MTPYGMREQAWFAWRPVRLESGKWAFWRTVVRCQRVPSWGDHAFEAYPWSYNEVSKGGGQPTGNHNI